MAAIKKNLKQVGCEIMQRVLAEDEISYSAEERQEAALARNILDGLKRLQSSLPSPSPEQLHALTTIRATAHSLIRTHGSSI